MTLNKDLNFILLLLLLTLALFRELRKWDMINQQAFY